MFTCNFNTWKAEAEMLSFRPTTQQKLHNEITSLSSKNTQTKPTDTKQTKSVQLTDNHHSPYIQKWGVYT